MLYADFPKRDQQAFMAAVKEKSGLTWDALANRLGIHRSMIYSYRRAQSKLPYARYIELCVVGNVKPLKMNLLTIRNKAIPVRLPDGPTPLLAELLGVLAGDGHISRINHEVSITGDSLLDREYLTNHVPSLFWFSFKVSTKTRFVRGRRAMRCLVNSARIVEYLTGECGLPLGKKKGNLHLPILLENDKALLTCFLRGLFDTDGSVYMRRGKDAVVCVVSADVVFLAEVREALASLGFSPSVSGKNLFIYGNEQVGKFFEEIKPNNERHLKRYDRFIKEILVLRSTHR